ncbi:MAG: ribosome silencing factor [Rhizobiales bacterium]|nr:ribosome silencing factor [Hyphomicrobiales bacterium]
MANRSLKNSSESENPSHSLNKLIVDTLDQNKAEDIVSINLIGKTSLADYMIIASGGSARHVSALADYVNKALKEKGNIEVSIEGLAHSDWVLLDCGDIIVHIFRPEVRDFYALEKMWTAEI